MDFQSYTLAAWLSSIGSTIAIIAGIASWISKKTKVKLVVSRWYANNEPDEWGNFIVIEGRAEGLIMWLLAKCGLDAVSGIFVSESSVHFKECSLSGPKLKIIPFSSISSILYEYHKPWKAALFLQNIFFAIAVFLMLLMQQAMGIQVNPSRPPEHIMWLGLIFGIAGGLVYYFLNRKLTLGFLEHSGIASIIQFKRSVIENQEINPEQANYVCLLIQGLIENQRLVTKSSL